MGNSGRRIAFILAMIINLAVVVEAKGKKEEGGADTSRAIVVSGLDGLAHACAISPHVLLTARHVAKAHQEGLLDAPSPSNYVVEGKVLNGEIGEPERKSWGLAVFVGDNEYMDIALMQSNVPYMSYPVATAPAQEGEKLYAADFSRKRKSLFQETQREFQVLTRLPGRLILDDEAHKGISGSCLLRHNVTDPAHPVDEIVGVVVANFVLPEEDNPSTILEAASAVAIFPPLRKILLQKAEEIEKALSEGK